MSMQSLRKHKIYQLAIILIARPQNSTVISLYAINNTPRAIFDEIKLILLAPGHTLKVKIKKFSHIETVSDTMDCANSLGGIEVNLFENVKFKHSKIFDNSERNLRGSEQYIRL
jgi:hypothetical protein